MIEVIGILYDKPPLDEDGEFTREPEQLVGFHVNSTNLITGLSEYQVTPENPQRVFAGVHTYFYTFESEEQAKELLNYTKVFEDEESEIWEYLPDFIPEIEVPEKIKSSSGLLILAQLGMYDQVVAYMSSPEATISEKIIFDREPYWYRNDALVSAMAGMFSLTDDQVDDMFIEADKL